MRGSRAVIAAGAGAVILALLVVFFLVLPKMSQVGEAQQELEDAQAEQQTLQSRLAALEQAQAQPGADNRRGA